MADEHHTSSYFFKGFGTCLVLVIALLIVGWVTKLHVREMIEIIGWVGFIALVIAIILSIWETW